MTKNNQTTLTRRQARELAFEFLFSHFLEHSEPSKEPCYFDKKDFEEFSHNFNKTPDTFSWELIEGTGKNLPEIDSLIVKNIMNWRFERIAKVELTLLRQFCFELIFYKKNPKQVVIDEAVELAKQYGEKDSSSFINGILDKIASNIVQ
jgi:N utilization substance protein B